MAWPDDRTLPIDVSAAFGADVTADPDTWTWTGLSARLLDEPITIRRQASTGGQVSPGTCTVALLNDDGALTPLHPLSPYWPNVELGTPLRVRLRRGEDGFGRTVVSGGWGLSESGQPWTTTGGAAPNHSVSGGVARHSHTFTGGLLRSDLAVQLRDCEQLVDVAPSVLLTGAPLMIGARFRVSDDGSDFYWLRAEFNSTSATVTLRINRTVANVATQLAVVNTGIEYGPGTYLRVRASVVGTRLAIKVWPAGGVEPSGWQATVIDDTDDAITEPGTAGLMSWLNAGNTNTLPVDALFKNYWLWVDRFSGFADQWEPVFVPAGVVGQMFSAVAVTASGVLRRLTQGRDVVRSPLRRTIAAGRPVAYYPAEDGVVATAAGSAVPGQNSLVVSGDVEFKPVEFYGLQSNLVRFGTSALADLAPGGSMSVLFDAGVAAATQGLWTVHAVGSFDPAALSGDLVLMEWTTPGGTYVRWQLVINTAATRTQVFAYTAAGVWTLVVERMGVLFGFRTWVVSAQQSGGNIIVTYRMPGGDTLTGTVAGTLAGVASMRINPTNTFSSIQMPFGHLAVWNSALPGYAVDGGIDQYGDRFVNPALTSYNAETAHLRLARLAAEDGVALQMPPVDADAITRMGWQPTATFADLISECVEADCGLLYERDYGLAYLPRSARYNQPPALTIDLATYRRSASGGSGVLTPVFDDQGIRNQWTVERRDGSFAVVDDLDSQRRGLYADSVELNLESDSALLDQATWRLHLTTAVDLREASIPIDLAANPQYIDGWLSCGIGSRIVRTNPPAQYRPGPLDRLVLGWTETLGPRSWTVQVTPELAAPWDVATVDGPQRVAADGSTLAAALTSTGTTFQLASTATNGVWTTAATEFPQDLRIGGEQVRVSAISGTSSPQTVTISARGLNGVQRAWPAGTPVDVWEPAIAAL